MPEIQYPGVYVEELPFGVAPITGVETSSTGFVGEAPDGPHLAAARVASFPEFERAFGGLRSGSELGYAVLQFFANGGSEAWVVGVPAGTPLAEGLSCLEAANELGLLCLPGETGVDVLRAALDYAERRRAFLLVDPPGVEPDRAIALVAALSGRGSANGALFYPPVRIPDPLAADSLRTCPPSGAVAGMYARNDLSRGVWRAPAGLNATLPGVVDAAVDLSDDDMSELTAAAVNCIRRLPATGIVVWGARTLAAGLQVDSEWKYVNVRRLALFIEASLYRGTSWAVFEPNDEPVWARLRRQCALFLDGLFRAGAFQGRAPDQAYFVRCGRDTMTQDDVEQGRLKLLVGFAPSKPAEFVILEIGRNLAHAITESLSTRGMPSEQLVLSHRPVCEEGVLLRVRGPEGWAMWTAVDDLDGLGPQAKVFVLNREEGELVFGDGKNGAVPPAGAGNVQATYRYGEGSATKPARKA